jgi:hypothetical protein
MCYSILVVHTLKSTVNTALVRFNPFHLIYCKILYYLITNCKYLVIGFMDFISILNPVSKL